jgi:hypothetical protein
VTDIRHTSLYEPKSPNADHMTWASAGPGCARGLGWVFPGDPNAFKYSSEKHQTIMLGNMQQLLKLSKDADFWPWQNKPWEMREVEHCLCEFDKWKRGSAGQSLKRLYRPAKRS